MSTDQDQFPPFAVFDLDGTLVDSRRTITAAMAAAFRAEGLDDPGYARTRMIVGLSLEEACARLAPADMPPAGVARLVAAYKHAFVAQRSAPDYHEPLYEGALDLVADLARTGWLIGVATGKARRGVQALQDRHPDLTAFFDTVHCADDGPGKPHPAMVLEAMRATGAPTQRTLVIGDTSHDMAMAVSAGVRALGVTWGFHTAEEITAAGAHEVHSDFSSLAESLARFAAGSSARQPTP